MRFEFATAGRIVFGPGAVREVAPAAKEMGGRALVVTGRSRERAAPVEGLAAAWLAVPGEPTLDLVREGVRAACEAGCRMVVAIGGGSALDAGKAVAALLTNGGDPLDYLEVIGGGQAAAAALRRRSSPSPPPRARARRSPATRCWRRPSTG